MTERMSDKRLGWFTDGCFGGKTGAETQELIDALEAERAKVRELEATIARVQWTVKKWRALNGLSITVGEVLADCANEIEEALQEPEHESVSV